MEIVGPNGCQNLEDNATVDLHQQTIHLAEVRESQQPDTEVQEVRGVPGNRDTGWRGGREHLRRGWLEQNQCFGSYHCHEPCDNPDARFLYPPSTTPGACPGGFPDGSAGTEARGYLEQRV